MARRRMISPDIWQDPWFGKLNHTEQIFFIGIISNCDDEGRILAEAPYLRSRIFIYQDIELDTIENMLIKLKTSNPNFCVYNTNGSRYIALKTWGKYQKPEHASPSTLPPPLNDSPNNSVNDSTKPSTTDSPPSIVKYSVVKYSVVEGDTNNKNKQTLREYIQNELQKEYSDLDIDEELKKFTLYWSEGNRKLKRPKLAFRNWLDKARQYRKEQELKNGGNYEPAQRRRPITYIGGTKAMGADS